MCRVITNLKVTELTVLGVELLFVANNVTSKFSPRTTSASLISLNLISLNMIKVYYILSKCMIMSYRIIQHIINGIQYNNFGFVDRIEFYILKYDKSILHFEQKYVYVIQDNPTYHKRHTI